MKFRPTSLSSVLFILLSQSALAQGTIEGQVQLPNTRVAPVMTKRYEVVTKGGVLATNPPLAVVYLEGVSRHPPPLPMKTIDQKDMDFIPALLPVQTGTRVEFPNEDDTYHNIFSYSPRNASTSAATGRMSARFLRKFSTSPAWSLCDATSTNTCAGSFWC